MKAGICPKCTSRQIYQRRDGLSAGAFPVGIGFIRTWLRARTLPLSVYICATCGYLESYATNVSLLPDVLAQHAWDRVVPDTP